LLLVQQVGLLTVQAETPHLTQPL